MTNANDWLRGWETSKPGFDPKAKLTGCNPESLKAGDVLDDGSILLHDGSFMAHGRLWMRESQAMAAGYYGWQPIDAVAGWMFQGEKIVYVGRYPS